MVTNRIIFHASRIQPNPDEIDYWVDLVDNPYGGSIKYYNGVDWVKLAMSGGSPDLSNYYNKELVNSLLNDKADISSVESKVDDAEVKDVIKDAVFNNSNSNSISLVLLRYDDTKDSIAVPIASSSSAGIITSKDFLDFVKQHQLQELHTEMIDALADIRAKYQKKLIAGSNITIDPETNVISASGELSVQWSNIIGKPDFKEVATTGDYNDLTNKLKPGEGIEITEDNTINVEVDLSEITTDIQDINNQITQINSTIDSEIDKVEKAILQEATTARAAEKANADNIQLNTKAISDLQSSVNTTASELRQSITTLQSSVNTTASELRQSITTEKNRAESAESTISTNLQNEIDRSTTQDAAHQSAIEKEIADRQSAIETEVNDRNNAIKVETDRATAKENELSTKIDDHVSSVNNSLALKADKTEVYTKEQVDQKVTGVYKVKGSKMFSELPTEGNVVGDTYNVIDSFTLNDKTYKAGTNVVWTDEGWDPLAGAFDTTEIEGGVEEVAAALQQEITDRTNADTAIRTDLTALTNRVSTNENSIAIINGNETTTGSISNAIKQSKEYTDSSVTTEKNRAEAAEQKLTSDLNSEITRALAAETANTTAIENEVERATGVEAGLRTDVDNLSDTKVDKVEGKGLSTNDYTTDEKTKLAGIAEGAEVNVLSDWNQTTDTADDYIKNKPGNASTTTDGLMSSADKSKLDGIANNANNYELPKATTSTLGGIIVGTGLTIDENGKLNSEGSYTLPTASDTVLGGVKIGANITNTDGTISITKDNVTSALGEDPSTKYVKKTGDTMTGTLTSASSSGSIVFKGTEKNDITNIYTDNGSINPLSDLVERAVDSDINAIRNGLAFNWYDTYWYIGNIRGSGTDSIGFGIANESNNLYLQVTPNDTAAPVFRATTATGTAPIQVSSTSLCNNLNADMIDGYQSDHFSLNKSNKSLLISSDDNKYCKIIELTKKPASPDSVYIKYGISVRSVTAVDYSNSTLYGDIEIFGPFDTNSVTYKVRCSSDFVNKGRLRAYVNGNTLLIWYIGYIWEKVATYKKTERNLNHFTVTYDIETATVLPNYNTITIEGDEPEDWYGVSWYETSSNPDCTRIGNMEMHRTLPILNAMQGFLIANNVDMNPIKGKILKLSSDWTLCEDLYNGDYTDYKDFMSDYGNYFNTMIKIPEFWYIDDYVESTLQHNLKICQRAKPGWHHHREGYVSAYEVKVDVNKFKSGPDNIPSVNMTRSNMLAYARNNDSSTNNWNMYTYEEHRAICHLFLVEYATRNSLKAVNTALTPEGFKQGGLGSGCTTGTVDGIYNFMLTGTSDSLGNGSGEVTWTPRDGSTTRKCNRYRGIENPFGHVWKNVIDVVSLYRSTYGMRVWYKCDEPAAFTTTTTNLNHYNALCSSTCVTENYKSKVVPTTSCDFFAKECSNGSESTYWCDYNWDNTDTLLHCLLIGGSSDYGGRAGLFNLLSPYAVGHSNVDVGSRITYLPYALKL